MRNNNKELEDCKCVFYYLKEQKPINIRKHKTLNYKIVKLHFFVSNELTNVEKIKTILNYKDYFHVYEDNSHLKWTELTDKSNYLRSGRDIMVNDSTILLKIEEKKLLYLKNYLKALSSSRKYIYIIINFYRQFLTSIQLLVDKKIVHNHVNFSSAMVDHNGIPLITNFEYSINVDDACKSLDYIRHFFIKYDPTYLEWPLEIHILSYLLTNKLTSLSFINIETIINEIIKNHTILNSFGNDIVSSYKEEAIQYFQKYVNQPYSYIVTDILQHFGTWDNYALSIMYLRILIHIHRTTKNQNKFIILFMKLLVNNIRLTPFKRFSIKETTNKFENLLDSLELNDYKDLLNNL
jgi:hypothetical protein